MSSIKVLRNRIISIAWFTSLFSGVIFSVFHSWILIWPVVSVHLVFAVVTLSLWENIPISKEGLSEPLHVSLVWPLAFISWILLEIGDFIIQTLDYSEVWGWIVTCLLNVAVLIHEVAFFSVLKLPSKMVAAVLHFLLFRNIKVR